MIFLILPDLAIINDQFPEFFYNITNIFSLTPEGLYVIFERILNEEYQLTKINRVFIDCRDLPNEIDCTLMISGSMKEVLKIAFRHALLDHGHKDTQELRKQLRTMLKPESKKNFIKKKGITK